MPSAYRGKEFEERLLLAIATEEAAGTLTGGRYGVQASHRKTPDGRMEWQPRASYPDFEGVLHGGRQWIIEAKTCAGPSLPLDSDKFRERQWAHMERRARFGAVCALAVRFLARTARGREWPESAWLLPVHPDLPLWKDYAAGEAKRFSREEVEHHGLRMTTWRPPRCRTARYRLAQGLHDVVTELSVAGVAQIKTGAGRFW